MLLPPSWRRVGAAMLALWFAVFLGESTVARACPMHGEQHGNVDSARGADSAPGRAGEEDVSASHRTHGAHGSHAAPGTGTEGASERYAPEGGAGGVPSAPGPCDCLGQCLGAAMLALHVPVDPWRAASVDDGGQRVDGRSSRPADRLPHRLPFATPPPTGSQAA